ncbi:hypothetical protein AVEN_215085-1 [Araneus ventricosus]|uniref:Uncharacterized protein n=1 Tax=Araneus ventricosus TaxID=182803 RepID=A0A4Y2X3Q6_ARAVE|nr:hypothetical protein AVEN_215085-1 [Araneus ventricosus]
MDLESMIPPIQMETLSLALESPYKRDDIGSRISDLFDSKDMALSPCHRSSSTNRDDIESAILRFQRHDYSMLSQSSRQTKKISDWNQGPPIQRHDYHHFIAVSLKQEYYRLSNQ